MAAIFKVTQPEEYFKAFRELGRRYDGRKANEFRKVTLNTGSLSKCHGSSVVKCGNTSVTCGISAELTTPKEETPTHGFLVPKVEIPESAGYRFNSATISHTTSELGQVTNELLINIIDSSKFIDTEDLCLKEGKLCWCLYCDIVCLSYDGNLLDISLLALVAALRNMKLPQIVYDEDERSHKLDPTSSRNLTLHNIPVSTTWMLYEDLMYVDGDREEEDMAQGSLSIVYKDKDTVCLMHKPGGRPLTKQTMSSCMNLARERWEEIEMTINKL